EMGEGNALEISMVANVERVDLHPVDRFEVYSTLVEGGVTVQDIANRYGMKLGEVRQCLALARMAPAVREAWREEKIDATAAEAFTLTSDHKSQESALKKVPKRPSAWQVRQLLLGDRAYTYDIDNMLKFVGRKEYEKSGGEIRATLFGND